MRAILWIGLFIAVLITPFVLRVVAHPDQRRQSSDDALRLVVISPHAENIRTEFADAFSAWHLAHYGKPVFIDYRIYGGSSDIVRFFDNARRTLYASLGTYKIDIVWGGGDDLFDRRLKKAGYLQGVALSGQIMRRAYEQPDIAGLALYDRSSNPPQWFGTALSSFGIIYNRDVTRRLVHGEPATWSDLKDPAYRNWIVLADPTRSGVAMMSFMIIVERAMQDATDQGRSADHGWAQGMGLIRQIAANARLFTDNSTAVPAGVGSGEYAAGMAIDFQARSQIAAMGPNSDRLNYVEPRGATAINPDPVAMVKGAEHPEVAEHFIEFLLSEPGQRLWITRAGAPGGPRSSSLRRMPVMKSLYDNPINFTDTVNPYRASADFNTSPARTATSIIIPELIQVSCMDLLDDLRETRAEILASPNAAELDARLGTFPFDQPEALRRAKLWYGSTPLQRLAIQRQWTDEFRREYASLRQQAAGATADARR
jgi:ABC-type Fe3+ transport system substrate-binding protein